MRDKKKTRKPDPKTPFFCARYQRFELWYEGVGWDLKRTDAMMQGRENTRYADICGDDIGAMAGEGWEFIADPACFTATHGNDRVIASAWAAPMRTEENEVGCNLTYAVDERYEGRSLARLLACLAFLACDQMHAGMAFANIESRADNAGSLALAASLGFTPYAEGDFTMPVAGPTAEVAFRCLRVDRSILRFHAEQTLEKCGLHDLLWLIRKARRPRRP